MLNAQSIVLVGGPDTGKTNFIGRLWLKLRNGESSLRLSGMPNEIKYVEEVVSHQHQGNFAPRTDKNVEVEQISLTIPLACVGAEQADASTELVIPDVSGEVWKTAVETNEIPRERMTQLEQAAGALVFVRVLSGLNVNPPDWVNAANLMGLQSQDSETVEMPTQVMLCEFLRFLELKICNADRARKSRIAVVVTAWDLLDNERSTAGPRAYLGKEYPLFAGRLADLDRFEVNIFGMSIFGGDPGADLSFQDDLLTGGVESAGNVRYWDGRELQDSPDIALPVAWVLQDSAAQG